MVKALRSLHPADEAAEAVIQKLGRGELVEITLRRPRNIRFHRLFYGLMNLVWQNIDRDEYPTVDALVTRIKIATGHRDEYHFGDGVVAYVPRSISFAAMDETEFSEFFERVADWVAQSVLPGVTSDELRAEIEPMIGVRS